MHCIHETGSQAKQPLVSMLSAYIATIDKSHIEAPVRIPDVCHTVHGMHLLLVLNTSGMDQASISTSWDPAW